ncbi:MAG: DUF4251 domain-containing protein [Bacteroidota bacterium]
MKFQYACLIFVLIIILSCGTQKPNATPEQLEKLSELVNQREFTIESDWAMPLTTNSLISLQNSGFFPPGSSASQISLVGTPNYFKVMGDSISAALPYFGEVQISAGHYGGDPGININDRIEDFTLEKNENKGTYKMKFRVNGETEGYRVFLTMFPNGRTSLRLNGNNRFTIEYTGNYSELDQDVQL